MHAPAIAVALRPRGHDVVAVAEHADLRALSDEELYSLAGQQQRRVVTENIKDFRPLLRRSEESGATPTPLLFTSSRTFPRTRRNRGPLIDALDAWLHAAATEPGPVEDWLMPAAGGPR